MSLTQDAWESMLIANERHAWAWCKFHIYDLRWIWSPAHVACDDVAIAKNLFDYPYMAIAIGTLSSRLQVDNRPYRRFAGNSPAELVSTRSPLPGVSIYSPWHVEAMQLIETLICPPRTIRIRERITGTLRWIPAIGLRAIPRGG